ncbi:MAG: RNA polymerase sigma factor, partial [Arsenicicoccus sp.]
MTARTTRTSTPELPPAFEHEALRALLATGTEQGYVEAEQVKTALEAADVTAAATQKKVLRVFSDQAIEVRAAEPAPARKRAPRKTAAKSGATTSAKSSGSSTTKSAAATSAAKTSATKTTAAKSATPKAAATKTAATKTTAAKTTAAKTSGTTRAASTAAAGSSTTTPAAPAKGRGRKKKDVVEEIVGADTPEEAEVEEAEEVEETPEAAKTKTPATKGDEDSFTLSTADDDDAPAQQVVTAGATADPV